MKKTIAVLIALTFFAGFSHSAKAASNIGDSDTYDKPLGLGEISELLEDPASVAVMRSEDVLFGAQEDEYRSQLRDLDQQIDRYYETMHSLGEQGVYLASQRDSADAQVNAYTRQISLLESQLLDLPEETQENAEILAEIRKEISLQISAYADARQSLVEQYDYFNRQMQAIPGQRSDYELQLTSLETQRIALDGQIRTLADARALLASRIENERITALHSLQLSYYNVCQAQERVEFLELQLELLEMEIRIESVKLSLPAQETTQAAINAMEVSSIALQDQLEAAKAQAQLLAGSVSGLLTNKAANISFVTPKGIDVSLRTNLEDLTECFLANSITMKEYDARIANLETLLGELRTALGSSSALYKLRQAEYDYICAQRSEYVTNLSLYIAARYIAYYTVEQNYQTAVASIQTSNLRISVLNAQHSVGNISDYDFLSEQLMLRRSMADVSAAIISKANVLAEIALLENGILLER